MCAHLYDSRFKNRGQQKSFLMFFKFLLVLLLLFFLENYSILKKSVNAPFSSAQKQLEVLGHYNQIPLLFEENHGQTNEQVKYLSRGNGFNLFLMEDQAVLTLQKKDSGPQKIPKKSAANKTYNVLKIECLEANPRPEIIGIEKRQAKTNYFVGNKPENWITKIDNWGQVKYKDIYPDIDLVYYGNKQNLEYDFVVSPGADPGRIKMSFNGPDELSIKENGDLNLVFGNEQLVFANPAIYQNTPNGKHSINGNYVKFASHEIGFEIKEYNKDLPLFIDPELVYSTFLDNANPRAIAIDKKGNAYVTGKTKTNNFPVTTGAYQTEQKKNTNQWTSDYEAFVTKFNSDGTDIIYSTYLGGGGGDEDGFSIAVDAYGNAHVTGITYSDDFPTTPGAFLTEFNKDGDSYSSYWWNVDGFVTKLNSTGSSIIYSSYLGGNYEDYGAGIDLDKNGYAYVAGFTRSENFPTTPGSYQPIAPGDTSSFGSWNANENGFISKINLDGTSLLYSTFLGHKDLGRGYSNEYVTDIAVDSVGYVYVTGKGILEGVYGTPDLFLAKLNTAGSALVFSTQIGNDNTDWARSFAIDIDQQGNSYITGTVGSFNFPIVNGFQPAHGDGSDRVAMWGDAFFAKINSAGSGILYSTFIGGESFDKGYDVTVDKANNVYLTGWTKSVNFPTKDAIQEQYAGDEWGGDVYVLKIDPSQSGAASLIYSTYLGGSKSERWGTSLDNYGPGYGLYPEDELERLGGIVVDSEQNVYVTGTTSSQDFPTTEGAYDTSLYNYGIAGFVTKIGKQKNEKFLIYNQVTMGGPPVFSRRPTTPQQILPQYLINTANDTVIFKFEGKSTDGTVVFRASNTRISGLNFPPLYLAAKVFNPADGEKTPFNLPNIGIGNVAKQFDVVQDGEYTIKVFAEESSSGPFPAPFQVHLAGNVGLPGLRDFPRAIRQDILFNHTAPRPQGIYGKDDGIAQTALFKFANPAEVSQFANAVIVPPPASPYGFPLNRAIIRAPDPMTPLHITTPTARTPVADGLDPTGMVVDFTQIPDPAIPGVEAPSLAGTVCAVIGQNDATSVTLPLEFGPTSLIMDMGSGQEIVDGDGDDFTVFSPSGNYTVAVSNTPFAGTFVPIGGITSGTKSFNLAATNLSSARFVLVVASPNVTIDAVKALNVFIDNVVQDPATGSQILVGDVGYATVTMRRAKAPELEFDPFVELIAPNGTRFAQNESGFGDNTSQDLSDAAMVSIDLVQSGFHRIFARGYDQSPGDQSSGAFFTRLESGGKFDVDDIIVSSSDEISLVPQKSGTITQTRQRDSFQFQWHPGQAVNISVSATENGLNPAIELYDPEAFLIAANDNFEGRGVNSVLQITLPSMSFNGNEALPDPSTYRLVVTGIDSATTSDTRPLADGSAFIRKMAGGTYEVKVFTGEVAGGSGIQPSIANSSPNIMVQGANNLALIVNGTNFENGATVSVTGDGITVNSIEFINSNQLKIVVDVSPEATPGYRDIIVKNPGGRSATGFGLLEIRASLGAVTLNWQPPLPNLDLAPPTNLTAQWGGELGNYWKKSNTNKSPKLQTRMQNIKERYRPIKAQNFMGTEINENGNAKIQQAPAELLNGIPVSGSVALNGSVEYFINVPTEAAYTLAITTSNSTGDPDLYVRFGSTPNVAAEIYDVVSDAPAPDEEISIIDRTIEPFLKPGNWYITVFGFESSTFTLKATYSEPVQLPNNSTVTDFVYDFEQRLYFINVPADATMLSFTTNGSIGDVDLYVRYNSVPDLYEYIFDFYSENEAPIQETITVDLNTSPPIQPGPWYVDVVGFGQATFTLTAAHNGTNGYSGSSPTSYNIYRSLSANPFNSGELLANVSAGESSFNDNPLSTQTFHYQVTAVYDESESVPSNETSVIVTHKNNQHVNSTPDDFQLYQNYPNPFNPTTTIEYALPTAGNVRIEIFDMLGRHIRTLVNLYQPMGQHFTSWDGMDDSNRPVAAGIYLYKMVAGDFVVMKKLVYVR